MSTKGSTKVTEEKILLSGVLGKIVIHGGKLSDVVWIEEIGIYTYFQTVFKHFACLQQH